MVGDPLRDACGHAAGGTTLACAAFWDWGSGHHVTGFEWFFVALAFLIDLSSYAGGRRARSSRD